VIPEDTVVFLQVGMCNAEQALKGNMLKIKKIMQADSPGALGPALEVMPHSLQAFQDNMQSHKDKFLGLQRSLYAGNSRLMAGEPDKQAYSNHDEATASFVLCDFGGGIFVYMKIDFLYKVCIDFEYKVFIQFLYRHSV